jgi:selenocysteine-specific elongation factor
LNRPRLPIDRVFTMSGFGTVVTGTLSDGHLSVGTEIEILPSGHSGRIRGLQTHRKKEETAVPGSRTAVNISGIDAESIQRGNVVTLPNQYQSTRRVDAQFRLLKDASTTVKHNTEVKFFIGASETVANLRLLGKEELLPGQEGWIQLELRDPVVAVRGDRYILRRPSPGETLGGGVIVDPQPKGRHKRFDEQVLKTLDSLLLGSPSDVLYEAALALKAAPIKDIVIRSHLEPSIAEGALQELLISNLLIPLEEGAPSVTSDILMIALPHWTGLREKTLSMIQSYHQTFPLRRGMPREELKSRLKESPRLFNALVSSLVKREAALDLGNSVALPGHSISFSAQQKPAIDALIRTFEQNPFSPPSVKECAAEIGEDVLDALIEQGQFILVAVDVVFRKQDYDLAVAKIRDLLLQHDRITLAEVRDLLKTSRKYAQALLEHLDAMGITVRDGDYRKLKKK